MLSREETTRVRDLLTHRRARDAENRLISLPRLWNRRLPRSPVSSFLPCSDRPWSLTSRRCYKHPRRRVAGSMSAVISAGGVVLDVMASKEDKSGARESRGLSIEIHSLKYKIHSRM